MARSSLFGIDPAAAEPAGRDKASLGPGDSSDSGSDVAGLDNDEDATDPGLPVDVALRDDQAAPLPLGESLASSEGGTGVRDGADIGVDHVFTVGGDAEDAGALLDAVDEAPLSEEDEDDEDQQEEDGAAGRRRTKTSPDGQAAGEDVPGGPDPAGHRPGRS